MKVVQIPWEDLRPDETQPRKTFDPEHLEAMEASFRLHGQVTPARVRPDPGGVTPFVLVDGECRWRVGRKLYQADPDDPKFSHFKAFVAAVDEQDLLVVQFLSNTGATHTPAEKVAVMKRLLETGVPRNKLRATLGIKKGQFRFLREFLDAPHWLQSYGEPQAMRMPVVDELGCPVRDDNGALTTTERTVPPLPLTHLAVLARYAARLVAWDKEQQAAHPDGDHVNVAQRTICAIADKAMRDAWTVSRLTKRCAAAVDAATQPAKSTAARSPASLPPRPFTRDVKGCLRIPTTDPSRLSDDALAILTLELERILSELRAAKGRNLSAASDPVLEQGAV